MDCSYEYWHNADIYDIKYLYNRLDNSKPVFIILLPTMLAKSWENEVLEKWYISILAVEFIFIEIEQIIGSFRPIKVF